MRTVLFVAIAVGLLPFTLCSGAEAAKGEDRHASEKPVVTTRALDEPKRRKAADEAEHLVTTTDHAPVIVGRDPGTPDPGTKPAIQIRQKMEAAK